MKLSDCRHGSAKISGVAGVLCRELEEKQLCDETLWARFVNEFRVRQDVERGAWRGEYWGKMMRGAVTVYEYTRSEKLYAVLENTVKDILTTEDAYGRISTYPPEKEFFGWDLWCRKYVILGLEFFLDICRDTELKEQIISSLCRQADYLCARIGDGKTDIRNTSAIWGGMNSSSILEPILKLYRLTLKKEYFTFAEHIINSGACRFADIFSLAYEDKKAPYEYGVSKAYEMMSCFEGLLEYYNLTGDEKAKTAVLNFAHKVAETDVTVIGSCGCTHELFDGSYLRQTADVSEDAIMQETCVSVTWLKLCEKLLRLTGDKIWADEAEKTFYNAYLGAYNPRFLQAKDVKKRCEEGALRYTPLLFDSYSPLTAGTRGRKTGGLQTLADGGYFGCCACIAAAGAGIFAASQVLECADGVAVMGFEEGVYGFTTPLGQKAELEISGNYPYGDGKVVIKLSLPSPEKFTVYVRRPGNLRGFVYTKWYECTAKKLIPAEGLWSDGDVLRLETDVSLKMLTAPLYDKTVSYNIDWKTGNMYTVEATQTEREKHKICFTRGPLTLALEEGFSCPDIELPLKPSLPEKYTPEVHSDAGHRLYVLLPLENGEKIPMCDYASAGSDWQTRLCAWCDARR